MNRQTNQLTNKQLTALSYVYDAIARLLPAEGKDFHTEVTFNDTSTSPNISITGLTPIGRVWAEHCMRNLKATLEQIIKER